MDKKKRTAKPAPTQAENPAPNTRRCTSVLCGDVAMQAYLLELACEGMQSISEQTTPSYGYFAALSLLASDVRTGIRDLILDPKVTAGGVR